MSDIDKKSLAVGQTSQEQRLQELIAQASKKRQRY